MNLLSNTNRIQNMRRILTLAIALLLFSTPTVFSQYERFDTVNPLVQPKMVKIYGAGGLKGLENYQSGFLISEDGVILTVWSIVLDADPVVVILNDGKRHEGKLLGYDPRTEIALLKIDGAALQHFEISEAVEIEPGARVLAFSNLYGVATGNEPTSVLHGVVSAKAQLDARRGAFRTAYTGPAYFVDAMTNNPGAAGGAVTDHRGTLVALIGKEYRDRLSNAWINYAIPIGELATSINAIKNNEPLQASSDARPPAEPMSLDLLGIVMVPDVLAKTPAFVDRLVAGSPAQLQGLKTDDLIIEINGRMVASHKDVVERLGMIDRIDTVELTVRRDREILSINLNAR